MTTKPVSFEDRLAELVSTRAYLKQVEDAAVEARRAADAEILQHCVLLKKEEGSVTVNVGLFKLEMKFGLERKVRDPDGLKTAWSVLPCAAQECFKWKPEVDLKRYRAVMELVPAAFAEVSKFVETKPKSPSVSVELVEEKRA